MDDTAAIPTTKSRTSRFFGIKLAHLVDAGLLPEGTKLVSTNGVHPASAIIRDRQIEYNDVLYDSVSAAAAAVKGGAANGWEFWAVDEPAGATPLATLRSRYLESKASS